MFTASDVRPVPSLRRGPLSTQLSFEACEPCVLLPESTDKVKQWVEEWGKETRVYWVKGKVRFPSASIVPLVKEQALEIKWSESRARKCWGICIQLEKFWMDTHNILACTSILFVRADAGGMPQFKKSLKLNWHKELHMWSQNTYKHTLL